MSNNLKITYLIDTVDDDLGGTENQLFKMIDGLNRRHNINVICLDRSMLSKNNVSLFKCRCIVIEINKLHRISTYMNFIKLIQYLRSNKPDAIHTFFPVANSLGVIAARLAGIKNIISSRRDYGEWMNRRYLIATIYANRYASKIIANSNSVKELTEKRERVEKGKVGVILNGIDTKRFCCLNRDYDLKQRMHIPVQDMVVGIVANFRPMKHHEIFVKAANEILKVRQDVSFVLVGSGKRQLEIESLGASLNIRHKLFFTGQQSAVIPYLSIMDIGVNCSKREGLSNAVMEYMAAGIPSIVSRAGGNTDLITHDVDGYQFELDDYRSLATLSVKLLNDDETRMLFIQNARKKIESEMSVEAMLSQYENLYRSNG